MQLKFLLILVQQSVEHCRVNNNAWTVTCFFYGLFWAIFWLNSGHCLPDFLGLFLQLNQCGFLLQVLLVDHHLERITHTNLFTLASCLCLIFCYKFVSGRSFEIKLAFILIILSLNCGCWMSFCGETYDLIWFLMNCLNLNCFASHLEPDSVLFGNSVLSVDHCRLILTLLFQCIFKLWEFYWLLYWITFKLAAEYEFSLLAACKFLSNTVSGVHRFRGQQGFISPWSH